MGFSLAFFQLEIAGDGTSSAQTTIQLAARIFGKSMVGDHGWPFSIGLSGGTMPSPSWIKNSGWSRFLAAWKIRVFYRRLLPRRTINSINISQVCEALCGFMRCFCFSKRQLTQDFHRLRNTSTVEFKFRPDSAVPTTTHTT